MRVSAGGKGPQQRGLGVRTGESVHDQPVGGLEVHRDQPGVPAEPSVGSEVVAHPVEGQLVEPHVRAGLLDQPDAEHADSPAGRGPELDFQWLRTPWSSLR